MKQRSRLQDISCHGPGFDISAKHRSPSWQVELRKASIRTRHLLCTNADKRLHQTGRYFAAHDFSICSRSDQYLGVKITTETLSYVRRASQPTLALDSQRPTRQSSQVNRLHLAAVAPSRQLDTAHEQLANLAVSILCE